MEWDANLVCESERDGHIAVGMGRAMLALTGLFTAVQVPPGHHGWNPKHSRKGSGSPAQHSAPPSGRK